VGELHAALVSRQLVQVVPPQPPHTPPAQVPLQHSENVEHATPGLKHTGPLDVVVVALLLLPAGRDVPAARLELLDVAVAREEEPPITDDDTVAPPDEEPVGDPVARQMRTAPSATHR
jgi:hypothetical protein